MKYILIIHISRSMEYWKHGKILTLFLVDPQAAPDGEDCPLDALVVPDTVSRSLDSPVVSLPLLDVPVQRRPRRVEVLSLGPVHIVLLYSHCCFLKCSLSTTWSSSVLIVWPLVYYSNEFINNVNSQNSWFRDLIRYRVFLFNRALTADKECLPNTLLTKV